MRRIASLVFLPLAAVATLASAASTAERQDELSRLLRDDCGACHGMTMKGGLGAPLTPAALAGKPDDGLVYVILNGLPGTAMPPWREFLSEADARWLVALLREGTHFGTTREGAP